MNLSKFLVLGALDILGEGSGYDIISELEIKMVDKWTDFKQGSIYFAIKQLKKEGMIEEVRQEQEGAFPIKSIYTVSSEGQKYFDKMQEEAFLGLFPYFFGYKLGLKFNLRRSNEEIVEFAKAAIKKVEKVMDEMEKYLSSITGKPELYENDSFFIQHDMYLFEQEKRWLKEVVERYK